MSIPDGGGERRRAASGSAARTGDVGDSKTSNGRRRRAYLRNAGRYAAGAGLGTLTLTLGAYCVLSFAIQRLGPPPLDKAGHLLPGAGSGQTRGTNQAQARLDPDAVDPRYLRMLFAFEDRRFYSHFGVDPIGIARAARDLLVNQRIITGGSTLTMQVARLLDNQYRRSPAVKVRQILRAVQLERALTKKEILAIYLAQAPFGGRTKGVRAASLKFFGKEPRWLSVGEAALLVALPQAPEARRLDRDADAARRARNFVLDAVTAAGVLTPSEAELAKLEPLSAGSSTMPPNPVPKPDAAKVAGLIAGLVLGINLASGPAAASPMQPTPRYLGSDRQIVLDVRRQLLKPQRAGTNQDDRDALWMFYAARSAPVWVSKTGWTPKAQAVIEEIRRADDWGLSAGDFAIPELADEASGAPPLAEQQLAEAEAGLSLAVLKYAREARGGRIEDPATQLSSYLDRRPQVRPPYLVVAGIATAATPEDYLRKLQPQHEQFARLREEYLARRDAGNDDAIEIPSGPKLKPGGSHADIALVRERLHVPAAGEDETLYDDRLVEAVKRFQAKHQIAPANGVLNAKTRRALNEGQKVALSTLLANMEEWRWMPEQLGETYVWVNVPEFMVRVVKDGQVVHAERIVAGEVDKQTPIFSQDMKTIYFHPRWIVPESIKVKEIGPAIARGRRRDLVVMRNGKVVKPSSVNWYKADIRNYDIYQPAGPDNALGLMKFTFPNKHMVYLHDTQSKGLFDAAQRTFSHGCVRVRNPRRLAEVLLGIDKGWTADQVAQLIKVKGDPVENRVDLDKHIPVHITYFTAQVDDDGEVTTQNDVYGHEKRITQALQGQWKDIDKGPDHLAQVELAQRLDDAGNAKRSWARRSGGGRRDVSRGYEGGGYGGGSPTLLSGSSANDVFRRSFGF